MKTTNKKSRAFVEAMKPFQGSNLKGEWRKDLYVVLSYGWYPLFVYEKNIDTWWENSKKYSMSTSKQSTQCAPHGVKTHKVTTQFLEDLILT